MCEVAHIDQVRNEEMQRRTGVTRELAGRSKQCALWGFGDMERIRERPVSDENSRI